EAREDAEAKSYTARADLMGIAAAQSARLALSSAACARPIHPRFLLRCGEALCRSRRSDPRAAGHSRYSPRCVAHRTSVRVLRFSIDDVEERSAMITAAIAQAAAPSTT